MLFILLNETVGLRGIDDGQFKNLDSGGYDNKAYAGFQAIHRARRGVATGVRGRADGSEPAAGKVRLEIPANENFAERTIEATIEGARAGRISDSMVFVVDLPERIRVADARARAVTDLDCRQYLYGSTARDLHRHDHKEKQHRRENRGEWI